MEKIWLDCFQAVADFGLGWEDIGGLLLVAVLGRVGEQGGHTAFELAGDVDDEAGFY